MKAAILLVMLSWVTVLPVFSLEEQIVLGREDNWKDTILKNVIKEPGKRGFLDLRLADGEYPHSPGTDLLLHFNTKPITIDAGNYSLHKVPVTISKPDLAHFGSGAAVFQGEREGLVLAPEQGALFYRGSEWDDFSIEFWLYPARLGDGETIFLWQGTDKTARGVISQEIRCTIQDRKLVFSFINVFRPPQREPLTITVRGTTSLIPRTWHHHILRFDSSTGLLEYALDGVPDGITYSNTRSRESSIVSLPRIGELSTSHLILGSGFTGLLDEFRISRTFLEQPFTKRYAQRTGFAQSKVFDLGYSNSELLEIDAITETPGSTAVSFYYRIGNDITTFQTTSDVSQGWRQFSPGERFAGENRGRYMQVLAELYPDGHGFISPAVSEIAITYEPDFPPPPPTLLTGTPGNGEITLSWNEVESPDIAGYLLYYGDKPGYYFGTESLQGSSPIDIGLTGSFTVQGLENGKLYYFSIAAYDTADPPHLSEYAREISVRPSSLLGRSQ